MRLAEPGWLVLLVGEHHFPGSWSGRDQGSSWPTFDGFTRAGTFAAVMMSSVPHWLRGGAIVAVRRVALARPQSVGGRIRIAGQGVAIMAVLDHSASMTIEDADKDGTPVSRLEAAKKTFARFVEGRPDDLIGLVVFANYPDRVSPLTLGHSFLLDMSRGLRPAGRRTTAPTSATRSPGGSKTSIPPGRGRKCSSS